MISVCSAYRALGTCFRAINRSASLYHVLNPVLLRVGVWTLALMTFHAFYFSFEFVSGMKRNVSGACISQKEKISGVFTMPFSGLTDMTAVRTATWNRWGNWGRAHAGRNAGAHNAGCGVPEPCSRQTIAWALSFLTLCTNRGKRPAVWACVHSMEINQLLQRILTRPGFWDLGMISQWFLIRNVCWSVVNIFTKLLQ